MIILKFIIKVNITRIFVYINNDLFTFKVYIMLNNKTLYVINKENNIFIY